MVANFLQWTIEDLVAMPDDDGWKRLEIIEGELFVTRAPHLGHQQVSGNIHFELEAWSRQSQLGKPFQTPGVIFSPIDAVIPDVAWIGRSRLAQGVDEAGHLTVAPELMVEILSPGERNEYRDKVVKLKLYSRYGVREYWVVNWQLQSIEIYRRTDARLELDSTLLITDILTSPLLPEFNVPLDRIFT